MILWKKKRCSNKLKHIIKCNTYSRIIQELKKMNIEKKRMYFVILLNKVNAKINISKCKDK
jgi:hypothetical protein